MIKLRHVVSLVIIYVIKLFVLVVHVYRMPYFFLIVASVYMYILGYYVISF